jgi:uncharacterized protein involved in exopolysaccharide biosynthesis
MPPSGESREPAVRASLTRVHELREPTLEDYLASARPYLRRVLAAVIAGTVLAAVIAFVWPPTYKAQATLLPPTEEDTGFSTASIFRGLNLPGVKIPSRAGPEDVTVSILKSRRLAGILANRFHLAEVYHVKSQEMAILRLQKRSEFKVDESGSVSITVKDRTPQRAADLANAYTEELDRFNRDFRMTKGRRVRMFVEQRMAETRDTLATAQKALEAYGEKHGTVALSPEQMSTVESAASLFARQSVLQTRLGIVREYASESSEEVRQVRDELDQLNRQISRLPSISMDVATLLREVKVQEQVFVLLSAQYEEARITEARDVPTVEVLDPATPPGTRSWPRRGLLIAAGLLISLLGCVAWIAWSVRRSYLGAPLRAR